MILLPLFTYICMFAMITRGELKAYWKFANLFGDTGESSRYLLRKTTRDLKKLHQETSECRPIVDALLRARRRVISNFLWRRIRGTHYERTRKEIRRLARRISVNAGLASFNARFASVIDTETEAERIKKCCRSCLKLNRRRLENGIPFRCFLFEDEPESEGSVKYWLNRRGEIVETRS